MTLISFEELCQKTRGNNQVPEHLLCIDPGDTTGWALFNKYKLVRWGHIRTVKDEVINWNNIWQLFINENPDYVVCEDYRVYQHKLARHSFSPVTTLRLIGGIDLLCNLGWYVSLGPHYIDEYGTYKDYHERYTCPIHYQMATTAKGFCSDERLKEWGFWQGGMKHARDAIRHGCYFLLFYKRGEDIV